MDSVETSGKTLEEAIEAAARDLGVTVDAVSYEVLDAGGKGFLGLGQTPVSIKASVGESSCCCCGCDKQEPVAAPTEEPAPAASGNLDENAQLFVDTVMAVLQDCLAAMKLDAKAVVGTVDEYEINIGLEGPDVAILIGRQGQTLDALEYLMQMAGMKVTECNQRFVLDADGYRERHKQMLMRSAREYAEEVKAHNSEAVLDPQPARERRIIHMALVDDPDVYTYSEGEGQDRHVVISPKTE